MKSWQPNASSLTFSQYNSHKLSSLFHLSFSLSISLPLSLYRAIDVCTDTTVEISKIVLLFASWCLYKLESESFWSPLSNGSGGGGRSTSTNAMCIYVYTLFKRHLLCVDSRQIGTTAETNCNEIFIHKVHFWMVNFELAVCNSLVLCSHCKGWFWFLVLYNFLTRAYAKTSIRLRLCGTYKLQFSFRTCFLIFRKWFSKIVCQL